jgi:hypothetical protein
MTLQSELYLNSLKFKEIDSEKGSEAIKAIIPDITWAIYAAEAKQKHSSEQQYMFLVTDNEVIIIRYPDALKDPGDQKFSTHNNATDVFFYPYRSIDTCVARFSESSDGILELTIKGRTISVKTDNKFAQKVITCIRNKS